MAREKNAADGQTHNFGKANNWWMPPRDAERGARRARATHGHATALEAASHSH
jgi:hypothetical protein